MLKFTRRTNSKSDLESPTGQLVSYATDPLRFNESTQLRRVSSLEQKVFENKPSSQKIPFAKTISLKTLNSIAKSIKSKFHQDKTTPLHQHSKSTECILSVEPAGTPAEYEGGYSAETKEEMATIRRVESDRRATQAPRKRPVSLYNSTSDNLLGRSSSLLHAQSIDGLHQKGYEESMPVKLSPFRQVPENLGRHQRSMSQRELSHHPDGIVDAFGFASSNGYSSLYQSTSNIHYGRNAQPQEFQHRKPPEVPQPPNNYQPAPPQRNESRNFKTQPNWRPIQSQSPVTNSTTTKELSSNAKMDRENSISQRKNSFDSPLQRNAFISKDQQKGTTSHPVNKNSFGPSVRRAESMKKIMQKNRKAENNNSSPSVTNSFEATGSEVVSEKGRSVKSIVGMFDHQPAIHAALAKAKVKQANSPLREENFKSTANAEVQFNGPTPQKTSQYSGRSEQEVVHTAKFVHLETTERPTNLADAQTSPIQFSPTEPLHQHGRPNIAKAETFNGGPMPKVAIMTSSSSSSYMSNDVFTPASENMDSPVFDGEHAYHRTDSSGRTHYSDGAVNSGGYDTAHTSYIPDSPNHQHSLQHPHIHNQLLRQEQTDAESSNHYEDLESIRPGSSVHEMENIYEPISPLRRDDATGNYMNYPSSPSRDLTEHSPPHNRPTLQGSLADRKNTDGVEGRPTSLPMDAHSPRHYAASNRFAEFNDSNEEQSYRNQVREASHRTLRQTSVEGNKYMKSPTREEQQLNRYNLNKSNGNPVQPVHPTNRSGSAVRPNSFSPYNSDGNLSSQESVNPRRRSVPHRTDSCRVPPRNNRIDRTSSYRENRGSSMDLKSEHRAAIKDNLREFYNRKSRDPNIDSSLHSSNQTSMSGTSSVAQSPMQHSPTRSQSHNMHRIQSERSFSTRNLPNPRGSNLERTPSMTASTPTGHRNSIEMAEHRPSDISPSYMQSWDASMVAQRNTSATSSERSPLSQTESPRVKKPLVAEVSPFSMPNQKTRKDRPSKQDINGSSSSVGSGVLKPMKASTPHSDSGHDAAPTLPPRNYLPDDIIANSSSTTEGQRSASEMDLTSTNAKPYQNVFNGTAKAGGDDYDAGYTDQLRRLSKNQYVRSTDAASKSSPQYPPARPQSQQFLSQSYQMPSPPQNQPINHSVHSPHHTGSVSTSAAGSKPHHRHSSSTSVLDSGSGRQFNSTERQQILETDIDEPSSPEVQPPPPPRRPAKEFNDSKPPPKPPKLAHTLYQHEINHNDPLRMPSTKQSERIPQHPLPERNEHISSVPSVSPKLQPKTSTPATNHVANFTAERHSPTPQARKDRGRSESMMLPKPVVDLTVTSGDPTAHLNRRQSIGKQGKNRRSASSAGILGREDNPQDSPKPSPSSRVHKRETEFSTPEISAKEKNVPKPAERLEAHVINSAISENKPKPVPFDRYHPMSGSRETLISHSRHGSSELLDTVGDASPLPASRLRGRSSPTPPPRSPKLSPSASVRSSVASLPESRKSTPSPHSSSSDVLRIGKSDPSTPVEKSFVPISTEILADLADQGINITQKHKCISDESKARLVKMETLNTASPPSGRKPPSIKHIRQKSSDEILCDTQVENLGKYIKDDTLTQVLSKPERDTTDYLPGLFDDLLTKDIPRKQRQSTDGSSCHSKQSSEGDSLVSSKASSTKELDAPFESDLKHVQDKKEELVQVLKKKLSVLQGDESFIKQEIEDNDNSGTELVKLVENKCNEREVRKFKSYIDDVETITKLLLKLSRRLARAENELRNAPMDATDDDKKSLEQKRNGLQRQHTEAKTLKGSIDKRKATVDTFLNRCLDNVEFERYDHYISIKLKLIMEISDIEDQIGHCEEQITAVTAISS